MLQALCVSKLTSGCAFGLQVDEGLPIEYLRYYRSGGYDLGTVAGGAKM
jgi:hypothetical protein